MRIIPALLIAVFISACGEQSAPTADKYDPASDSLRFPGEVHLRNIRQLTFGGNNAEAYFNYDDQSIIFQSDWSRLHDQGCDQQFVMNVDGSALADGQQYRLVSTGHGRTTCGYFLPDGRVLFASTHAAADECPESQPFSQGRYVWPIHPTYDIYSAKADGSDVELLIGGEGYDAEATVSPDGRFVIFTSTRSGDIDLWRYEVATGDLLQLTKELGYDGGAFFSRASDKIVWRASRPAGEDAEVYASLLGQNLVEPKALNLFVANIDGSEARQVTHLPGANWAPFFHPDGQRIIFASNHHTLEQGGREFDLFLIGVDGTGLERVTHSGTFDAFPMFSFGGDKLVFASNRNVSRAPSRDTNVFVADWVELPEEADLDFQGAPPLP